MDPSIKNTFFYDGCAVDRSGHAIILNPQPFQGGFEDFLRSDPFINTKQICNPSRTSTFDDLIYYWTNELPFDFNAANPTQLSLFYYPLRIAAAEFANYANFLLDQIEIFEYSTEDSLHSLTDLQSHYRVLQIYRRSSRASLKKIRAIIGFLNSHHIKVLTSEIWELLMVDCKHIAEQIEGHMGELDAMVPTVTSLLQITDSRQSIVETKNLKRLANLALVFVPLTYVAGLFSMSGNIAPGGRLFWVYFAVSVPLLLAVGFLAAGLPEKFTHLVLYYSLVSKVSGRR